MICFSAIYASLSLVPLFKVMGAPGFIPLARISEPLMGVILGPPAFVAAALGGLIAYLITGSGPFGPLSFLPGASSALFSGLMARGKRKLCFCSYLAALLALALWPRAGPSWACPIFLWLHLVGLPLSAHKPGDLIDEDLKRRSFSFFVLSLASTLFGHLVGCLMFVSLFYAMGGQMDWGALWWSLVLIYPVERSIIALASTALGLPILETLRRAGLLGPRESPERDLLL